MDLAPGPRSRLRKWFRQVVKAAQPVDVYRLGGPVICAASSGGCFNALLTASSASFRCSVVRAALPAGRA